MQQDSREMVTFVDPSTRERLRRFVSRKVACPDDAEDLVQITLLEAWKGVEGFSGRSTPETWLFGIAKNVIRGYYNGRFALRTALEGYAVAPLEEALEYPSDAATPEEICSRRQVLKCVERALDSIPDDFREPLQMSLEGNTSYRDIAEQLSMPIGTVRSRISRARDMLQAGLAVA